MQSVVMQDFLLGCMSHMRNNGRLSYLAGDTYIYTYTYLFIGIMTNHYQDPPKNNGKQHMTANMFFSKLLFLRASSRDLVKQLYL